MQKALTPVISSMNDCFADDAVEEAQETGLAWIKGLDSPFQISRQLIWGCSQLRDRAARLMITLVNVSTSAVQKKMTSRCHQCPLENDRFATCGLQMTSFASHSNNAYKFNEKIAMSRLDNA